MLELINKIQKNNAYVWAEGPQLGLAFSQGVNQELVNLLKDNKEALLSFLEKNKIFSKEQFKSQVIFKTEDEIKPLSFAQARMLFIGQYEGESSLYHISNLVKLKLGVSIECFKQAIDMVVVRHPVLNSVLAFDEIGEGIQRVLPSTVLMSSEYSLDEKMLMKRVQQAVEKPFNLSEEPGFRLCHYEVNGDNYVLLVWHHAVVDGWSLDVFLRELNASYQAITQKVTLQLPEITVSYGDYAHWQRDYCASEAGKSQLTYWQQQLSGYETLSIPTDKVRPEKFSYCGDKHRFTFSRTLSAQLRALAQAQSTTLYTVLLSAWYVTLYRLTGQCDIVIGTPSDGRHHSQTQSMIGMFVNSLALRTEVDAQEAVTALIDRVHSMVTGAKANQDVPFEQVIDALSVERDPSRHPLFQVMFSVQSFGQDVAQQDVPFEVVALDETVNQLAKFDLSLFLSDSAEAISGQVTFATSLFEHDTIVRISAMYDQVLNQFIAVPQGQVKDINVLSEQERNKLLTMLNPNEIACPQEMTLQGLFEAQVVQTPNNIALEFEGERLTYAQLNARANQLARRLLCRYEQQHGHHMPIDTLIALYFERSIEMVVSILAVIKAGGAYVPISPDYPSGRTEFILSDTRTPLLLTHTAQVRKISGVIDECELAVSVLCADEIQKNEMMSNTNLSRVRHSHDLAYVIYTSGTTGRPKGVMIAHHSVVNLAQELYQQNWTDKKLSWGWSVAYVFDASVKGLSQLFLGQCLHILPETVKTDPQKLCQYLPNLGVLDATPMGAALWFEAGLEADLPDLIIGGEAITPSFWAQLVNWQSKYERVALNVYGPTECTVDATACEIVGHIPHIGRPLNNVQAYVLDEHQTLLPIGAVGELYIGGAGLARGYLNRSELTESRFIEHPFATEQERKKGYTRLYRTGDLVRWLANGNLEYLGRNDQQVKIRGYRIELGEVGSVLNELDGVHQAVVVDVDRTGSKMLVGYVVPTDEGCDVSILLRQLSEHLPQYMVPANITLVTQLPLTINGKLDRKALPDPKWGDADLETYRAPRNELEEQFCRVWADVLGIEQVGIDDDFFHLGGDSIRAIMVASKLKHKFDVTLSLADLFSYRTIANYMNNENVVSTLLKNLTPFNDASRKVFMIHPSMAGSEVYLPLIDAIGKEVNAYGIENWNHVSSKKIGSLKDIANKYLSLILEHISIEEPIYLMGWSMGGQIASEIAWNLEKLGAKNINICLLDTFNHYDNPYYSDFSSDVRVLIKEFTNLECEITIDNYLDSYDYERSICASPLSGVLSYSKIFLYKAMNVTDEQVLNTKDNYISTWSSKPVSIIHVDEAHHFNIIQTVSDIIRGKGLEYLYSGLSDESKAVSLVEENEY